MARLPLNVDPARERSVETRLTVIVLCADWCTVCRDFETDFDALARANPDLYFRWVDIEDEPDVVGDLDITTFPTVIVASAAGLHFGGAVLPQAAVVARLIEQARTGAVASVGALTAEYLRVHAATRPATPAGSR